MDVPAAGRCCGPAEGLEETVPGVLPGSSVPYDAEAELLVDVVPVTCAHVHSAHSLSMIG